MPATEVYYGHHGCPAGTSRRNQETGEYDYINPHTSKHIRIGNHLHTSPIREITIVLAIVKMGRGEAESDCDYRWILRKRVKEF